MVSSKKAYSVAVKWAASVLSVVAILLLVLYSMDGRSESQISPVVAPEAKTIAQEEEKKGVPLLSMRSDMKPRTNEITDPDSALPDYMHLCERRLDIVDIDPETGEEVPRKSRRFTKAEQREAKLIIRVVAEEMGADPDLLILWALRESTYRPYKRHVLPADVRAAVEAWGSHLYTPERMDKAEGAIEDYTRKRAAWLKVVGKWKARIKNLEPGTERYKRAQKKLKKAQENFAKGGKGAALARAWYRRMLVYKDNPTYKSEWRWRAGYGLYGMQPVFHLKRWDPKAPPEVLCDPVIASVVAVWSARRARNTCVATGQGDSYEAVNRGFSRGQCDKFIPYRDKAFRKRAERLGIEFTESAQLGDRWDQAGTDREKILEHMRGRVERAKRRSRLAEMKRKRGSSSG